MMTAITTFALYAVAIAGVWHLVVCAGHISATEKKHLLLAGSIPFALEVSLQQRWLYVPLDRMLGGWNVVSIVQQTLCVTAIILFSNLIFEATGRLFPRVLLWGIGGISVLSMLALFDWAMWLGSDPFLDDWIGTPRGAAYTSIPWVAMFVISAIALHGLASEWKERKPTELARALILVAVGTILAGVTAGLHFLIVANAALGAPIAVGREISILIMSLAAGLIAFGLALPSQPALARAVSLSSRCRRLLPRLGRIWVQVRATGSAHGSGRRAARAFDMFTVWPRRLLDRLWIEVADSMLLGYGADLSEGDHRFLEHVRSALRDPVKSG